MPDSPTQFERFCHRQNDPIHAMRYHWPASLGQGWQARDHWYLAVVEDGVLILEDADQAPRELHPGSCRMVPAHRRHRLRSMEADGAIESYLLLRAELIADFVAILGSESADLPWHASAAIWDCQLAPDEVEAFTRFIDDLILQIPTRHDGIEALCRVLRWQRRSKPSPYADLPAWLRQAMIKLRRPDYLQEGIPALARICDRSSDHINRVIRHHRQCTATALINDLRIELAASMLRLSDTPIEDIAARVGLRDPSHFHKVFKRLRGMTPAQYRAQTIRQ